MVSEALWVGSSHLLSRGLLMPRSEPWEQGLLSTVVRLPPDFAARLRTAALALPDLARHHVYPAETVHMTVLSLEGADPDGVRAAVRAAVAATPPFEVQVLGLGLSPGTVFAQLLPSSRALAELRLRVAQVPRTGLARPLAVPPLRGFAHANLVRFRGPVSPALVHAVGARRREPLGTFRVDQVELSRGDKVLSADATTVLERIRLGG